MERVFADFNNADSKGRVRLTTNGSLHDIEKKAINLVDSLELLLDDHDGLSTIGIVEFSKEEKIWVAKIDWNDFD